MIVFVEKVMSSLFILCKKVIFKYLCTVGNYNCTKVKNKKVVDNR